jgi:WD repeat-containing protein 22
MHTTTFLTQRSFLQQPHDTYLKDLNINCSKYSRAYKGHSGCVNALSLNEKNSLMASGGDDKTVFLWRTTMDVESAAPIAKFKGHESNIFSIEFDSSAKRLFSCGNDGLILQYDLTSAAVYSKTTLASDVALGHSSAILKLSVCPNQDSIFLTAGQDGEIRLWDNRTDDYTNHIETQTGQNSVSFHPTQPHLFLSTDRSGGIYLRDLRFCFSQNSLYVRKYNTRLYNGSSGRRSVPLDIPSAVWSPDGKRLGAIINCYKPTIYTLDDPDPICILDASTYKSLSTIKTGAWDASSTYFYSGSDDFHAYGWKIPMDKELLSKQKTSPTFDGICFKKDTECVQPLVIDAPSITLGTHRSIVNTVVCHQYYPMVYTAGVEKLIRQFSSSPFPLDPERVSSTLGRRRCENPSRLLGLSMLLSGRMDEEDDSIEESASTLAFFDILQSTDERDLSIWMDESSDEEEARKRSRLE